MEPQSLAKSNDQLTFEEKNQAKILSDSLSPVNGKVMEQQFKAAPMAYGDDLESITSSEFDANSIFVTDSSRLVKHQNAESNDQTKSHEMLKYNKKKDSSSNHSSLLDLANRNDKKNAESQALYQRDKSHTSLSAFRGTVDQDSEMNQMDQLFENFKNSKDTKRLETKPKFAYKRDLSKENAIHSVPSSPMPNSNRYREVPIDPVDEYLQLQLQQHEQAEPKPVNKIPKSNHMSLMRKPKNPFTNFERTISIKSINDHFSHDPNIKISGRICVKLSYEKKSSNLSVNIHSCDTLALIKKDCPNAYVKVYLKSNDNEKDKNMKRKTPVIKNNRSPIFDETLRYIISSSELDNHYLEISVWHKDKFGRNKYLGEVTVRLNSDVSDRASNQWYDLANRV
ncbi:synaptotagmin 5 isoform X1 [Brachionus plicatilis]|uniref:Synaptotagmin 5 isoform X1 n=1 Tax=Brachionus plicatilis TaxID=10195 RepID=A0A3M7QUR0_BRAPC|nr:synaptotagmin 5 isoform X1 [Brachionus plicatilis]